MWGHHRGHHRWIIADAALLGVVGALSAQLFMLMLEGSHTFFLVWLAKYVPPGLPDEGGVLRQMIGTYGMWLVPATTTLGGLISGLLVYGLVPEAEGDGTDTAIKAFHQTGGFIRTLVTPLKAVASAITIGSGGSAGREGPISLISAGVGSIYATLGKRSDEDRRILVLIGMAAGLAAIFRSPIGTAIFAIEVLYTGMEFEANVLLYTMLGSLVAYVVNGLFVGWTPLFHVPPGLAAPGFADYAWYAVLGCASGVAATLIPVVFYGTRDIFHKLPVPPHIKPAIGGFCVGILALVLPEVIAGGYGWIQEAIDGRLPLMILFALVFAKMLAFALTVSSGGSGGVFAPSLFVGAMVGGFFATLFHQPSAPFAIVGMAAVLGGAGRVPIATLLMVPEMTGGYQLLVPAALAVSLSYFVQTVLSPYVKYRSLYEAQLPSRAASPAHDMENMCIALDLMCKPWASDPNEPLHVDLLTLLRSGAAVSLAEGKQLTIGVLQKKSTWVDKPLRLGYMLEMKEDIEIIAILRGGRIILARPETVLKTGDRLLMITTPQIQKQLDQHLAPLSSDRGPASKNP